MKADSTEKSEIDFSTLNEKSRRKLHRALYRQGCRAWLLWCAMGFGGFALFQGLHNKENLALPANGWLKLDFPALDKAPDQHGETRSRFGIYRDF